MASICPRAGGRVALFDNAKGALIVLVVLGHFMNPVHTANPAMNYLFDIIYLFHMPLFVFISGLFAKGARRGGRLGWNRIISFAVLGVAYQVALLLVTGNFTVAKVLMFKSAPWYLVGMAWWYLSTPLLDRLGPRAGTAACLAAAFASGLVDLSSGVLALGRALSFLPFFAAGYYCPVGAAERLAGRRCLWAAVAAAAAIAAARALDPHVLDWFTPMVYGDNPFGADVAAGAAAKAAAMAVAVVFSLAVLRLLPRGGGRLAVLGERTLQVYVLHRLIRAWLTFRTGFYSLPFVADPLAGTAAVLLISAAVVAATSVRALGRPFAAVMRHRWLDI